MTSRFSKPSTDDPSVALDLVFVVDPDVPAGERTRHTLVEWGFRVETFSVGRAALHRLRVSTPAALCLDPHRSRESGLEVLSRALELRQDLAVVVVSESRRVDDVVHAMRLGAWDYVTKPVDGTKLAATIRQAAGSTMGEAGVRNGSDPIYEGSLEELERRAIAAAMERRGGNRTAVARELGIGRTTLYRKLRDFEID